jgi:hypothetical protein
MSPAEAPLAAPAPPVPPAPAPPAVPQEVHQRENSGNFSWSNDDERLEASYRGDVEFTDDDADVKRLSPNGYLKIKQTKDGTRTIELRADSSGSIQRRFWVGSSERPFEPEGRQWLAQVLPRFIRQTGLGAHARVARIFAAKGAPGVLAEISLIEGSWAKRRYFSELLNNTTVDAQTSRQVIAQAGREIDSDFELASLLIESADRLLQDDATRQAYFDAARTIQSDFEMRRTLSAALKRGAMKPALVASMLEASAAIDSDFEEASLLVETVKSQPLDATTRGPFFKAASSISSDFERRRVLDAAVSADQSPVTLKAALDAATMSSDFESASLLLDIVKAHPIDDSLRPSFFKVVEGISSDFERGRVLQAVAGRDPAAETTLAVLRAAKQMRSDFETARVLLSVAERQNLTGPARDLYIETANGLGDFEQNRALAALARRKG